MSVTSTLGAIRAALAAWPAFRPASAGGTWPETRGPAVLEWPDASQLEAAAIYLEPADGSFEIKSIMNGVVPLVHTWRMHVVGTVGPRPYTDAMALFEAMFTGLIEFCHDSPDINGVQSLIAIGHDGPNRTPSADSNGVVVTFSIELEIVEFRP